MTSFATSEKHLSQIPALQLLIGMGYEYLPPARALIMRDRKMSNVLLEDVLRTQLERINRVHYKDTEYLFSEANIQEAVRKLKNVKYDGLLEANEKIYDLITLGTALQQKVEGNLRSFNLNYIDWKNPANNRFHVVPEYSVERSRSTETVRPDIVLFVNGIPLGVIECKPPNIDIEEAVSQNIRNQGREHIPKLFAYAQLVMGINKNGAKYATVGTPANLWSVWNELEDEEAQIAKTVNTPLNSDQKSELFSGRFAEDREYFDQLEKEGARIITEQDKSIYGLCRPERLLDLAYRFTLFDGGTKKIARYQQFFVVRSTLERVKRRGTDGKREGGTVWHTQGSGKSLTMVMLTRSLTLDPDTAGARIVLVTDRIDLDKQLGNTFRACGLSRQRATSGKNLVEHLNNNVGIITTLVHKFKMDHTAISLADNSSDIFVLVDEGHRTHYGDLSSMMEKMLPDACYISFTGTPLLKARRNTLVKFGGFIEPRYSYKRAVQDKAVVPLLYEARHVEMELNQSALDTWFERQTDRLTAAQKADLKRKYAHANTLNKTDQVVYMRALDIGLHYQTTWQNTRFKAQLVAPDKATAIKYHKCLEEIGMISSEVIISGPGGHKEHTEVDGEPADTVREFWTQVMRRFNKSEDEYNRRIIRQFKDEDDPKILIVVNKLLTGFDAPRNTFLYLCHKLKEHNLLQAIARVNRLCEGKRFGHIVDYVGTLGEMDRALTMYDALENFEEQDLDGMLTSIKEEVRKLPDRHSRLLDIFQRIKNRKDQEEFERLLANETRRERFYERLTEFKRSLEIALSTREFVTKTDPAEFNMYKNDRKRFEHLRQSVRDRYAETIDYHDYEQKIRKLLDTHIYATRVTKLNEPVDLLENRSSGDIGEQPRIYSGVSTGAKADMIAYATRKFINEKMGEDPAFYNEFSSLIKNAIEAFRRDRISDQEYLDRVLVIGRKLVAKRRDDVPDIISRNAEACAYYGVVQPHFPDSDRDKAVAAEAALSIQKILDRHWKVDFWMDENTQNDTRNDIDDLLLDDVNKNPGISLSTEQMDEIIEETMRVAKNRRSDQ